jgi:hypothetical protein
MSSIGPGSVSPPRLLRRLTIQVTALNYATQHHARVTVCRASLHAYAKPTKLQQAAFALQFLDRAGEIPLPGHGGEVAQVPQPQGRLPDHTCGVWSRPIQSWTGSRARTKNGSRKADTSVTNEEETHVADPGQYSNISIFDVGVDRVAGVPIVAEAGRQA